MIGRTDLMGGNTGSNVDVLDKVIVWMRISGAAERIRYFAINYKDPGVFCEAPFRAENSEVFLFDITAQLDMPAYANIFGILSSSANA